MRKAQVGDIYVSRWGYDQTNVDFYQVIARTKHFVTVRELRKTHETGPHDLASYVRPIKDGFMDNDTPYEQRCGKPIRRKLKKAVYSYYFDTQGPHEEEYFKPHDFATASPWDGNAQIETYTH